MDSAENYSNYAPFIHFFFDTIGASFLACLSTVICYRKIEKKVPKKKRCAKGYAPLNRAATRRATAFEKAVQNNRRVRANKVLDKSKFSTCEKSRQKLLIKLKKDYTKRIIYGIM